MWLWVVATTYAVLFHIGTRCKGEAIELLGPDFQGKLVLHQANASGRNGSNSFRDLVHRTRAPEHWAPVVRAVLLLAVEPSFDAALKRTELLAYCLVHSKCPPRRRGSFLTNRRTTATGGCFE